MTTDIQADPNDPKTVKVRGTYWRLWQSTSDRGIGGYYATRSGTLTEQQMAAGCEMTLDADSHEELTERLLSQPDVTPDGK